MILHPQRDLLEMPKRKTRYGVKKTRKFSFVRDQLIPQLARVRLVIPITCTSDLPFSTRGDYDGQVVLYYDRQNNVRAEVTPVDLLCDHSPDSHVMCTQMQCLPEKETRDNLVLFKNGLPVIYSPYPIGPYDDTEQSDDIDWPWTWSIELNSPWVLHWRQIVAVLSHIEPEFNEQLATLVVRYSECVWDTHNQVRGRVGGSTYANLDPLPISYHCSAEERNIQRLYPSQLGFRKSKALGFATKKGKHTLQ